jgi:hypothetical protein
LPDSGADLCSQPTISRWEHAPALRDLIRLMVLCRSHLHIHQQLSFFNAHYDERCFLPIHVYDTQRWCGR